jgi:hypothetical protein
MEHGRPFRSRQVLVTPMNKSDQDRIKAKATLSQPIFMARRGVLITDLHQYAMRHKMGQPLRKNAPGDAEPRMQIIEATHTQKRLAQDQQGPAIADN